MKNQNKEYISNIDATINLIMIIAVLALMFFTSEANIMNIIILYMTGVWTGVYLFTIILEIQRRKKYGVSR